VLVRGLPRPGRLATVERPASHSSQASRSRKSSLPNFLISVLGMLPTFRRLCHDFIFRRISSGSSERASWVSSVTTRFNGISLVIQPSHQSAFSSQSGSNLAEETFSQNSSWKFPRTHLNALAAAKFFCLVAPKMMFYFYCWPSWYPPYFLDTNMISYFVAGFKCFFRPSIWNSSVNVAEDFRLATRNS